MIFNYVWRALRELNKRFKNTSMKLKHIFSTIFILLFILETTASTLVVTNVSDTGVGSLRSQIFDANSGDTIRFSPTLLASGSNTILLSSKIIFSKNLTIIGLYNSSDTLYISGGNSTGIFRIDNASKVYFDSIVIINGKSDWGGAIRFNNSDSLFVHNSILRNNSVTQQGGAIHGANYLSLKNTLVKNNTATFSGGGVYCSSLKVDNCIISGNVAENTYGGGVYAHSSALISNSVITNNHAQERGGGIYVFNGTCDLINSTVGYNSVVNSGGGIHSFWVNLNNSTVTHNSANFGGGIDVTILLEVENNSQVTNNTAQVDGGGIFTELSTDSIIIDNSSLSNNVANGRGGGIYAYASSGSLSHTWIKINNSILNNNIAAWGGGIHSEAYFSAHFLIYIDNSTLSNNTSTTNAGGGIYSFSSVSVSSVNVNHSTFSNNHGYSGGGIYSRGASSVVTIKTSTFSNNSADNGGGAICSSSTGTFNTTDIENSTIYQNTASSGNGIYAGTLNLKGSILFNPGGVSNLEYTTLNSLGYNVFNDFSLPDSHVTDSLNISSSQLNLGPLQNNGGINETHVPSFNSIAFDTGDPFDFLSAQNSTIDGIRDRGAAEGNCRSYALSEMIACESYTWAYDNHTYFNDTIISDTIFNGNVNGCDSIVTLNLTINNPSTGTDVISSCDSYTWINGNTYTVSNNTATDTLTNAAGCDSIVTLNLTIGDLQGPIPDLTNLNLVNSNCEVSSLVPPTATDNCSGTITGTNTVTFPISTSTTMTWSFTDGAGNTVTQNQDIIINLTDNSITQLTGSTLQANATGVSYQWVNCLAGNSPVAGETSQTFIATTNGEYAVLIDNGTCEVMSDCININLGGIFETVQNSGFSIYPNPSNGKFMIESEKIIDSYEISNSLGQVIYSDSKLDQKLVQVSQKLAPGVYFVKVIMLGDSRAIKTITIEN